MNSLLFFFPCDVDNSFLRSKISLFLTVHSHLKSKKEFPFTNHFKLLIGPDQFANLKIWVFEIRGTSCLKSVIGYTWKICMVMI